MICHGIHGVDYRNILYAFIYSNIPCINSAHSVYCSLERPIVHAALKEIEQRLGKDKFPLIQQTFYPDYREMNFTPEYPIVVKVGHVHAGYGKMKLDEHHTFEDLKSVMALAPHYITAEHYYEPEYDLRIQKIGNHYRAFKKIAVGSWKSNTGACVVEDVPLTVEYKRWIDEGSKIFGGLEICAIDAIHCSKDNKDYILEINDTAIGLAPHKEHEDMPIMCDLVMARVKQILQSKKQGPAADGAQQQQQQQKDKTSSEDQSLEVINVQLANTKNDLLEAKAELKESQQQVEKYKAANTEMKQTLLQFNERHKQHVQWINDLTEDGYEGSKRVMRIAKTIISYTLVAAMSVFAAKWFMATGSK